MPKFKKVILKPGVYKSPDGEINISPSRIKHWSTQFNLMTKEGLNIPIPWGHQTLDPNAKEYFESKFNAGFLDKLEVSDEDELLGIFDIPREEDASRIGTVVREVSPQIETNWSDGSGRIWEDVITHVALVTHPVVGKQSNFTPEAPKNAMRLSLNMRVTEMAKDDDDKEKKPVDDKEKNPANKKSEDKGEKVHSGSVDSDLLDALQKIGIILPDDTTSTNLSERLLPAVLTLAAKLDEIDAGAGGEKPGDKGDEIDLDALLGGKGGEKEGKEEDNAEAQDQGEKKPVKKVPEEVPPTMTMSLSKELDTSKARLSLLEGQLENQTRERMKTTIKDLLNTGRITPVIAQKLKGKIDIYKLSLNQKGELINSIQDEIEMFSLMPEGSAWDNRIRLSKATEQDLPIEFDTLDDNKANKIAEEQLKTSGRSLTLTF